MKGLTWSNAYKEAAFFASIAFQDNRNRNHMLHGSIQKHTHSNTMALPRHQLHAQFILLFDSYTRWRFLNIYNPPNVGSDIFTIAIEFVN